MHQMGVKQTVFAISVSWIHCLDENDNDDDDDETTNDDETLTILFA